MQRPNPIDVSYRRRGELFLRGSVASGHRRTCRWCPAQVVDARHPRSGRSVVLDWETRRVAGRDDRGVTYLGLISHWATCPRADEARLATDLKRAAARSRSDRAAGIQELPFPEPVATGHRAEDDPG